RAAGCLERHAAGRDVCHEPREAGIAEDDVAAATQDMQRQRAAAHELQRVPHVLCRRAVAEITGGAAEADSGVRGERDRLSNQHSITIMPGLTTALPRAIVWARSGRTRVRAKD